MAPPEKGRPLRKEDSLAINYATSTRGTCRELRTGKDHQYGIFHHNIIWESFEKYPRHISKPASLTKRTPNLSWAPTWHEGGVVVRRRYTT